VSVEVGRGDGSKRVAWWTIAAIGCMEVWLLVTMIFFMR
jgi:hypothetical protein